MASNRTELIALKNLLSETNLVLSTTQLPENRTARCRELLKAALTLTDDLISQAKLPAASALERGLDRVSAAAPSSGKEGTFQTGIFVAPMRDGHHLDV